jgi:Cys-tRNA(Pro)/Cys-tRNA(Cys) deacylase
VTQGKSRNYFVFVIPVAEELDLKKAAAIAGEKSVEMIPVKDITAVTGYIRGGCSPVGMKKLFKTFIHESATGLETIIISGGRIGIQIELDPEDLIKAVNGVFADIIMNRG